MAKLTTSKLKGDWKKKLIIISMIAMILGLLFSRALLSSGLIIFLLLTTFNLQFPEQTRIFFRSPVLWSISLLFIFPYIIGLWNEDRVQWMQVLQIKLPLILLPFGFAGISNFDSKDWRRIAWLIILTSLVASGWSLFQYFRDFETIHAAYLRSAVIDTPMDNDHVRFSLFITIAILTALRLLIAEREGLTKNQIIIIWVSVIFLVIYLHILAARTGLICFYFSAMVLSIWRLGRKKDKWQVGLFITFLVILPVAAYFILPTFKNRVSYLRYDLRFVQKDAYQKGSNDGNRFRSIRAGIAVFQSRPLTGVGFGGLRSATDNWYNQHYPGMAESDKILPCSDLIVQGAAGGIPGILVFCIAIFIPMFIPGLRKNIFWIILNGCFLLSYLFDMGLEVQYGVFMHAFIIPFYYFYLKEKAGENLRS
jgi:O-antigen ligase